MADLRAALGTSIIVAPKFISPWCHTAGEPSSPTGVEERGSRAGRIVAWPPATAGTPSRVRRRVSW